VLAAVMRFLERRSERMAERFERWSRWLRAKALGVPLGADLAGDEWEDPVILPLDPEPPPIPPSAFFRTAAPANDEEWNAAIVAAKQATPAPVPAEAQASEEEWEAALLAAKRNSASMPVAEPAAAAVAKAPARITASVAAAPARTTATVTPAPARITAPRTRTASAEVTATRQVVAAALRTQRTTGSMTAAAGPAARGARAS
jgi:hypothetical protein